MLPVDSHVHSQWSWAALHGWWHAGGGQAVTFGSDAHEAAVLGRGFPEAVAMGEACGFRPGPTPRGAWVRNDC